MSDHQYIEVTGTHGRLLVHRESGVIVAAYAYEEVELAPGHYSTEISEQMPEAYADIALFDTTRWDHYALTYGETDILCTAYVTDAGHYERELTYNEDGYLNEPVLLGAPS